MSWILPFAATAAFLFEALAGLGAASPACSTTAGAAAAWAAAASALFLAPAALAACFELGAGGGLPVPWLASRLCSLFCFFTAGGPAGTAAALCFLYGLRTRQAEKH